MKRVFARSAFHYHYASIIDIEDVTDLFFFGHSFIAAERSKRPISFDFPESNFQCRHGNGSRQRFMVTAIVNALRLRDFNVT